MEEEHLLPEEAGLLARIRARKKVVIAEHRRKKSVGNNQSIMPRRVDAGRTATTSNLKVLARVCTWAVCFVANKGAHIAECDAQSCRRRCRGWASMRRRRWRGRAAARSRVRGASACGQPTPWTWTRTRRLKSASTAQSPGRPLAGHEAWTSRSDACAMSGCSWAMSVLLPQVDVAGTLAEHCGASAGEWHERKSEDEEHKDGRQSAAAAWQNGTQGGGGSPHPQPQAQASLLWQTKQRQYGLAIEQHFVVRCCCVCRFVDLAVCSMSYVGSAHACKRRLAASKLR